MSKPFFFRIDVSDLFDFATDPEGEGMTLLQFAKELKKGESSHVFIQSVIDEASNYIENKRKAGAKGGLAKASSAIAKASSANVCSSRGLAKASTPLARSSSSSSSSTVTEPIKNKPKTVKRFAPPTLTDIKTYCLERKNQVDPERFIDHYTSNGWLVGKNKMKDWKAAVRTWEKNSNNGGTHGQDKRHSSLDIAGVGTDYADGF